MADQQSRNVFISFQGDDNIGQNFAGTLFKALSDRGFHTKLSFKDQNVTLKDIGEFRFVIVIFPENLTEEPLDEELSYIVENFELNGDNPQFLYPIFYNTNPSHVKITADRILRTSNSREDTDNLETKLIDEWHAAVHRVANMPGWHFKHGVSRDENENELINKIVEDVSRTFDGVPPLHIGILDLFHKVSRTFVNQVSLVFQDKTTWRLRVVGFISSFAGLLCYALSPSFNRLIRGWKPFSIIVYVVLCLVILVIISFAKQASPSTQQSRNRLELKKTCIAFAALIIISVYSFFYDKAVNGKPHILSVISNVAFAMVSLSLRKLTNSWFEIGGFSYFFSCFTIQLLTINLMLIFVAIISGFMLFLMRYSLNYQPEVEGDELLGEHNA